ncbi:MAG: YlxM family DNA-binding protein [Bacillota bacterium]|nr:YlxM family DNA-binding protein [Bacillota bacterium]
MLEKINRVNYLFDFYGLLLTDKQQNVIEMYYEDNFSLAEAAEHLNITRQAVHDILSRAVYALEDWEKKLRLYEIYLQRKKEGEKILELLSHQHLKDDEINKIKEKVQRFMIDN